MDLPLSIISVNFYSQPCDEGFGLLSRPCSYVLPINASHSDLISHTYLEDVLPKSSTDLVAGFTQTISTTLFVESD